jgi:hypothetical protein
MVEITIAHQLFAYKYKINGIAFHCWAQRKITSFTLPAFTFSTNVPIHWLGPTPSMEIFYHLKRDTPLYCPVFSIAMTSRMSSTTHTTWWFIFISTDFANSTIWYIMTVGTIFNIFSHIYQCLS